MTTQARDLPSLILALEQATEPSRKLDAQIAVAVGWRERGGMFGWEWISPGGRMAELPFYTRSLDAAMGLVPDGCEWRVAKHMHGWSGQTKVFTNEAKISRWELLGTKTISEAASGATPALALCLAALRARLAIDGKG
jgi:hypothetical protein